MFSKQATVNKQQLRCGLNEIFGNTWFLKEFVGIWCARERVNKRLVAMRIAGDIRKSRVYWQSCCRMVSKKTRLIEEQLRCESKETLGKSIMHGNVVIWFTNAKKQLINK